MLRLEARASSKPARGLPHGARLAHKPCETHAWCLTRQLANLTAIAAAAVVLSPAPSANAIPNHATPVVEQARIAINPLAELSGLADGTQREERDPITPFTLYGTSIKKYLIETLQGEKVVSRKKGFTVDSCVGAVEVTEETPQFQGLPTGDKALYAKDRVCRRAEGEDMKDTCRSACEAACSEALDTYAARVTEESGFALLASDKARMGKSCARNCQYECVKPGRAFDFVIPYRR